MPGNIGKGSALDSAGHKAFLEVFLHKGIGDEHGGRSDDDGSKLDHFRHLVQFRVTAGDHAGLVGGSGRFDQNVAQHQGKGRLFVSHIDEGREPVVPVRHHRENDHDREDRGGQRDDHRKEDAEVAGPVDARGFLQGAGDAVFKIVACDDGVAHSDAAGQEHGPDGLHDPGLLHDQVGGDQAAAEVHGDNEEDADQLPSGHFLHRKRIRYQIDQRHRVNGADHGVQDAVAITAHDVGLGKHRLVSVKGKLAGQQEGLAGVHIVRIREGRHKHVIQRISHDEEDDH